MKNVTYMGNAFPHNYADAWDDDRGMMVLEYGNEPKFVNWPDMPRYITIKVSELLEDPDKYLKPKMYVRVTLDIKISYEEANFVRDIHRQIPIERTTTDTRTGGQRTATTC